MGPIEEYAFTVGPILVMWLMNFYEFIANCFRSHECSIREASHGVAIWLCRHC